MMQKLDRMNKELVYSILSYSWFDWVVILIDCIMIWFLFKNPLNVYLGIVWLIVRGWRR